MCGIAGFISTPQIVVPGTVDAVRRMASHMHRRGPDAQGIWTDEGVVLGHRRLAILDLDVRANQPMLSADGRYVIVFNGEIYNFRELRRELENAGVCFRTSSDTEVLVELFARHGEHMLVKLRGMFVFAIWDVIASELFLARDPYGIKPLYYTQTKNGFLFASQVKALVASGQVSAERENAGLAGFYLWGSVPEPWTLYRGVFALPAGHWMRVRNGQAVESICWHDIRQHWRGQGLHLAPKELQERVHLAVWDSVRAHLVADVPVSVFLSGGIDSAAVAGIAAGLGAKVEGITVGFDEFAGQRDDEVAAASAVAAHFGLPHFVRKVSRAEFEQDIPYIHNAMDQPSIDGVNTWFASKAAAERGYKVALSGIGGDELFCGYSSFRKVPRMTTYGRAIGAIPGARALLLPPCNLLAKLRSQPKFAGIPAFIGSLEGGYFLGRCLFLPAELPALIGSDVARDGLARLGGSPPGMSLAGAREDSAAIGLLESTHYLRNQLLRDSDWASMGHSIELRTPLIDAALLGALGPYLSGFGGGAGKKILARSPAKLLPESIVNRPKTGFSIPIAKWLSETTGQPAWSNLSLVTAPGTPWARRWARIVIESLAN